MSRCVLSFDVCVCVQCIYFFPQRKTISLNIEMTKSNLKLSRSYNGPTIIVSSVQLSNSDRSKS